MPAKPAAPAPDPPGPPYWVAVEPLYVHNPESGVLPARAFSAGDHVPPDLVEANGWGGQVTYPAGYTTAPASPPRPAPAAATTHPPAAKE